MICWATARPLHAPVPRALLVNGFRPTEALNSPMFSQSVVCLFTHIKPDKNVFYIVLVLLPLTVTSIVPIVNNNETGGLADHALTLPRLAYYQIFPTLLGI